MNERILLSLVQSVYSTLIEPSRWPLILKECEALVEAEVCDLAAYHFERRAGAIVAHSGYYEENFLNLYKNEYAASNPWLRQKHRYLLDGAVWVGRDLCPHEQLIRTSFFNHWLRPQRLYHRSCSVIWHDNVSTVYFSALRARQRNNFERHELRLVQQLIPHIRQVFELQRCLGVQRETVPESLLQVAHRVQEALVVIGTGGRVLEANASGEQFLARHKDSMATGKLRARINSALSTASCRGAESGGRVSLKDSEDRRTSVNVVPLPPDSLHGLAQPAAVIMSCDSNEDAGTQRRKETSAGKRLTWRPLVIETNQSSADEVGKKHKPTDVQNAPQTDLKWNDGSYSLVEPTDQIEANRKRLQVLYNLTPAESRLATQLACGYTLQECAANLDVSISTVRTHLQRVFGKTDTHHQGELVARLLAGPANLSIHCVPVEAPYEEYA